MSQEKVQKYKEEKANRKKNIKKQKRLHRLSIIGYSLLACAIIGFIGWSVYDRYIKEEETPSVMSQEEWSSLYADYLATYQPTQAVTDKNGETVTDENGKVVTETVTTTEPSSDDKSGETTADDKSQTTDSKKSDEASTTAPADK